MTREAKAAAARTRMRTLESRREAAIIRLVTLEMQLRKARRSVADYAKPVRSPRRRPAKPQASPPVSASPAPAAQVPADFTPIPDFLVRKAAHAPGPGARAAADAMVDVIDRDAQVRAEIEREQAERKTAKARGRIAKMKAQRSGETRRMPLQGKAALAAIRGE